MTSHLGILAALSLSLCVTASIACGNATSGSSTGGSTTSTGSTGSAGSTGTTGTTVGFSTSGTSAGGAACSALAACCADLGGPLATSCNATVTQPGVTDAQCSQALTALQMGGTCGGIGTGTGTGASTGTATVGGSGSAAPSCTTLAACCPTLPAIEMPSECMVVVADASSSACTASLMAYQTAGYCAAATDAGGPSCTGEATFQIVFSPMYSAVIPGGSQVFQVPVVATGVSPSAVTWAVSGSAASVTADESTGGALLTMNSSSPRASATVTATVGGQCASALLGITMGTLASWTTGQSRFNDGEGADAGAREACSDCHTAAAPAGAPFTDVAATPQQTAGFTDAQLLAVIQNGTIPAGGYFDSTLVSQPKFQMFHQYNLTTAEETGIVLYLRGLTPTAQKGTAGGGH